MKSINRRDVIKAATQAAVAAVASNVFIQHSLGRPRLLGGSLPGAPAGENAEDILARMKPWLIDANCAPAKDQRLLTQIQRVHAWILQAFQLDQQTWKTATGKESGKSSSQIITLTSNKALTFRLPEPGHSLQFSARALHGTAPDDGAVVVVHANGREVFRSSVLTPGQEPDERQIDLEKARTIVVSIIASEKANPAAITVELRSSMVELANGRKIPLATITGIPEFTELSPLSPPFSFLYGGRSVREELGRWRRRISRKVEKSCIRYEISYRDPATDLEIICDLQAFTDFPAVNWVLHLTNHGSTDTLLLEQVLPLDINLTLPETGDVVLHHSNGSSTGHGYLSGSPTDFLPAQQSVGDGEKIGLAPNGGRSSDTVLPFFNLQWAGGGMVAAVGWTGQWSMCLQNGSNRCASWQAGQQTTRMKLYPGESIRTPSIALVPWQGDSAISGSNLLRRLLLTHFAARIENKIAVPPVSMWQISTAGGGQTLNDVNEKNQLAAVEQIAENRFGAEVFWLDAGWMPGGWQAGVGSWIANPKTFPDGLKPVADAANKRGMQFLLWFEPERVWPNTLIAKRHPEWLLHNAPWGAQGLFDMGNPKARRWMTQLLADRIKEWNIGILRQDFNITPLPFWLQADKPDRQGITEIRYIEGLYAMWDELRSRFPLLAIDCCASGGRRIDIESIKRCFYLWRSDIMCFGQPNATWCQAESAGLNRYVPTNAGGTGNANVDVYDFRSSATAGVNLYIPQTPQQVILLREAIAELKMLRPLYLGDYYPLTPTGIDNTKWEAWQFDRPEMGMGFVMYFRRPKCVNSMAHFELQNLIPEALYKVAWKGSTYRFEGTRVMTGRELTHFSAISKDQRGTGLLIYRREDS